ncbi:MAG: TMEM165/GDT1 family protein [Candidatus Bathyarchaeota archaeon]|nr:MAG: TMEM165/GDT1 family protein [Candidatus Bathyarchaeota archaeon]
MSMNFTSLVASFVLVAVAELGDKTQIAVITLSSRFKAFSVFSGAMLAFLLTTGIAVAIGDALTLVLPIFWIRVIAAAILLIFGVYTIISRKEEAEVKTKEVRNAVFYSFSLVTLMELGDKTQFAVIALSAEYDFPLLVYVGVMMAFAIITGLGATIGATLTRFVSLKYIQLGGGLIFILFGIVFLINALLGFTSFV